MLISVPGGRFPRARLQSPSHSENNAPAVTRRKDIGQKKLTNVFPAGLSARAVPAGVAAFHFNQLDRLLKNE